MKKKVLSLLLAFALLLTYVPLGGTIEVEAGNYNASAAVAYAAEHWDDPPESSGDCARFVSNCLAAGGCTAWSAGVYELKRQLTNGGWGNLYVLTESGSTVYEWQNAGILSAGDPIFYRCLACGDDVWPHVVICGGFDSQGRATAYGHTAPWGAVTYVGDYWDIHNHKGSDIVAYSFHMNATQPSYSYTSITPGTYYLKHNATGMYMDIESAVDANNAKIWLYDFNGTVAQQYAFTHETSSDPTKFILRPLSSGSRIVNAAGYSISSGAKVCLWDDVNDITQRWRFQKVNGGYTIHNAQNTNCVIVPNSSNDLYVYTYTGGADQIWSIQNSIDYNANGGTGAPGTQMKNYNEAATLSNTIPTRDGYDFLGWSTSSTATTPAYYAGSRFTANQNTLLYAVWAKSCNHSWLAATCGAPKTCALCGETEGAATGAHSWIDATCTDPKICTLCGATQGSPLPHTTSSSTVCDVCGEVDESIFKYTVENGVATITGYSDYNAYIYTFGDLILPDTIGGYPVRAIGIGAFSYEGCKRLVIPDSVTTINDDAFFEGCYEEDIYISKNVTFIGTAAFATRLTVDPENEVYTSLDGVLFSKDMTRLVLYPSGRGGSSYIVPDGVTTIEGGSFYFNTVSEITIPESVTFIGEGAFSLGEDCLKTIYGYAGTCAETYAAELAEWYDVTFVSLCRHTWQDATCTIAKTCTICGETDGEVPGHAWSGATCTSPNTCTVCGITEGEALGHQYEVCGDCMAKTHRMWSSHPYEADAYSSYYHVYEEAEELAVTFSADTFVETDFDFIYIYDAENILIGRYTGDELAGSTILVPGDRVVIRLESDESVCKYGYEAIVTVSKCIHADGWQAIKPATCTTAGKEVGVCALCGEEDSRIAPAIGHAWIDATCTIPKACGNCGETDGTALGHNHVDGICTRCGDSIIPGDVDGVAGVTADDAVYLLYHTMLPEQYPLTNSGDMNGDDTVDANDAIYLLYYFLLPEQYPLP